MALKTDFEDASFISSPFVDEVANPGTSGIDRAQEALKEIGVTGEIRRRSGVPKGGSSAPTPGAIDKRNTGQKIIDKGEKIREALPPHLRD